MGLTDLGFELRLVALRRRASQEGLINITRAQADNTSVGLEPLRHLLGLSVTLVISVSDAATSRRASCDSVRGRPARDGVPPTPPPRGPSIRSDCIIQDGSVIIRRHTVTVPANLKLPGLMGPSNPYRTNLIANA